MIFIDYRNNATSSFLGFSLYVSNTTNRLQGTLCFKDDYFNRSTIPAVFNTTCQIQGQYVIYFNERLHGVSYPSDYNEYAENDLCEVEVYGEDSTPILFVFNAPKVKNWFLSRLIDMSSNMFTSCLITKYLFLSWCLFFTPHNYHIIYAFIKPKWIVLSNGMR